MAAFAPWQHGRPGKIPAEELRAASDQQKYGPRKEMIQKLNWRAMLQMQLQCGKPSARRHQRPSQQKHTNAENSAVKAGSTSPATVQQVLSLHGSLTGGARSALLQALVACPALDFHQAAEEALSLTTGDDAAHHHVDYTTWSPDKG